jgi:copper(I)-binding protein
MMKKMRKRHSFAVAGLLAATLLAGCQKDRTPRVDAEDAWVRLPAVKGEAAAGYFSLEANMEGMTLTGITSPQARRIEMHETTEKNGVSKMKMTRSVEFPSRGALKFEPGGRHAMIFGLDPALKPGDKVTLTFAFDMTPPVTVDAEVRNLAGTTDTEAMPGMEGMNHSGH